MLHPRLTDDTLALVYTAVREAHLALVLNQADAEVYSWLDESTSALALLEQTLETLQPAYDRQRLAVYLTKNKR